MRILVIEDNESVARFLADSLEAEWYAVDMAFDGAEGSFLARTNDYDAIILDNILPKKSGKEVCLDIRMQGKTLPILVISAVSDTEAKVSLFDAGIDDYVTKPFAINELLARVRALLRRPKTLVETVLCLDDLEIDIARHRVSRGGDAIRMTKKEFALLEYLMRNQDRILSRASIMEHVWDAHADPFSNTLESHMVSIRKKIDTPGKRKLIRTVSGCGYGMTTDG